ncbi:hypothetical protein Ppro_0551 [Pelobacter propionicus DSM 2379]|uniref:Uncharacterized protein n=1 Tax=Pelobacter propionicus (strain DSM 2379 / NBRC 103807 / OttBd1) TaxID=338966 RepID=A1ALG2_PELPD|nr:hypothetical protein Ppro_0551 [Pelobacter propionicus DSM 2379]
MAWKRAGHECSSAPLPSMCNPDPVPAPSEITIYKARHRCFPSISITLSYRIILEFLLQDQEIIPVNVGDHDTCTETAPAKPGIGAFVERLLKTRRKQDETDFRKNARNSNHRPSGLERPETQTNCGSKKHQW